MSSPAQQPGLPAPHAHRRAAAGAASRQCQPWWPARPAHHHHDLLQGINVYRFANRIPLLFEGGSDVITKTALKRINWGAYKINQSADKVGPWLGGPLCRTRTDTPGKGLHARSHAASPMLAMLHVGLAALAASPARGCT